MFTWFKENFFGIDYLSSDIGWGGLSIQIELKNTTMLILFILALPILFMIYRWAKNTFVNGKRFVQATLKDGYRIVPNKTAE